MTPGARAEATPGTTIEQKIAGSASRFDLPALLDLLHHAGYRDEEIEYRSHFTTTHQAALVHAVEFHDRRVIITVNLGLLSSQGPLPSYFHMLIEQQQDSSLEEFLAFFDHHLLRSRVHSLYPERDPAVISDWEDTKRQLLQLLGLTSPSTLHWIFCWVFPELGVSVRRSVQRQELRTDGVLLGSAALGSGCAFGGVASIPIGGIDVTLFAEEQSGNGTPWVTEVPRRLREQVLPLLAQSGLCLTLVLVLRDRSSIAQLRDDRYLGFDPLGRGIDPRIDPGAGVQPKAEANQAKKVLVFSGEARA